MILNNLQFPGLMSLIPCIFPSAGRGRSSSAAPWHDCEPFHSQPDGAPLPLTRQPTQRPRKLAPAQSASASRRVLSRHLPRHSHCRPPSAPPKAPADRRQPPIYPNSSPDYRACNSLTPFRCPHAVHPCPSVDSGLNRILEGLIPGIHADWGQSSVGSGMRMIWTSRRLRSGSSWAPMAKGVTVWPVALASSAARWAARSTSCC